MAKDKKKKTPSKGVKPEKDPDTPVVTKETTEVEEKAAEQTVPSEDTGEKEIVQVLVKVPPYIRDKAKQEADLAYLYKWIPEPTVTALFIWLVDYYLDVGIKQYIAKRRGATEHQPEGELHGG